MMDGETLVTYADHTWIAALLAVSSLALLIYDYVLCLPMEIEYIWPAPWNLGKVLYFGTRYLAFTDVPLYVAHMIGNQLPLSTCRMLFSWCAWSIVVGVSISCIILAMRTWIIWSSKRLLALILGVAYLGSWFPIVVLMAIYWGSNDYVTPPSPAIQGCVILNPQKTLWLVYFLLNIFELCVFVLTLIKGVEYVFRDRKLLITTLYKDAILFGFTTCMLGFANMIVILSLSTDYAYCLVGIHRVIHSILSGRIILHLREASAKGEGTGAGQGMASSMWDLELKDLPRVVSAVRSQTETRMPREEAS